MSSTSAERWEVRDGVCCGPRCVSCAPLAVAAFLAAAADKYSYMMCMSSAPVAWPEQTYPLGEPHGPAVEIQKGVFRRLFGGGGSRGGASKPTEVWYDKNRKQGNITWGGRQPPPPPPPPLLLKKFRVEE